MLFYYVTTPTVRRQVGLLIFCDYAGYFAEAEKLGHCMVVQQQMWCIENPTPNTCTKSVIAVPQPFSISL